MNKEERFEQLYLLLIKKIKDNFPKHILPDIMEFRVPYGTEIAYIKAEGSVCDEPENIQFSVKTVICSKPGTDYSYKTDREPRLKDWLKRPNKWKIDKCIIELEKTLIMLS